MELKCYLRTSVALDCGFEFPRARDDDDDRPTNPVLLKGIDWGDDIRSPMLREVDRHEKVVEGIKRAPSQPPKDRLSHHAICSTSRLRMCLRLTLAEKLLGSLHNSALSRGCGLIKTLEP